MTLNIERDGVLISQSEQQSLFTSNQEDAGTRIALHFSEMSKSVSIKTKDFILIMYTSDVIFPPYDWHVLIENDKIFEKLGKIKDANLPMLTSVSFHTGYVTLSAFSLEYQKLHGFSATAEVCICSTSHRKTS